MIFFFIFFTGIAECLWNSAWRFCWDFEWDSVNCLCQNGSCWGQGTFSWGN